MELRQQPLLGMKGFKALSILAVFKKTCEIVLYKKGSHVKSCFIILNMSL